MLCRNGVPGSAICSYRMSDIQRSFEGEFKAQETPESIWLPVEEKKVPRPHPAKVTSSYWARAYSTHTMHIVSR